MTNDQTRNLQRTWKQDGWIFLPGFLGDRVPPSACDLAVPDIPEDHRAFAGRPHQNGTASQFAAMTSFPFSSPELSLLAVDRELLQIVSSLIADEYPLLYQAQLWFKMFGYTDYEQTHHRDYAKNTMLVPSAASRDDLIEGFIYLTDVDYGDGPTALVSRQHSQQLPIEPARYAASDCPDLYELEQLACGPTGSVLLYSCDVFHRATDLTRPGSARLSIKFSFKRRLATWVSYHQALRVGFEPAWSAFVRNADDYQLQCVGFPIDDRTTTSRNERYLSGVHRNPPHPTADARVGP